MVKNSLVCTVLACLLSVVVTCWVESVGSGTETGKETLGFMVADECGVAGGWVMGCVGMRGLLKFILEVSEYGVTIINVVVYSRLCMYVEALYCAVVDAFFWNCNTRMTSCMFPRVCDCSIRCSVYLEV